MIVALASADAGPVYLLAVVAVVAIAVAFVAHRELDGDGDVWLITPLEDDDEDGDA